MQKFAEEPAPASSIRQVEWADGDSWAVAVYAAVNASVTLTAVYLASETYRVDLQDAPTAESLIQETGSGTGLRPSAVQPVI